MRTRVGALGLTEIQKHFSNLPLGLDGRLDGLEGSE